MESTENLSVEELEFPSLSATTALTMCCPSAIGLEGSKEALLPSA